MAGRIPQNFIDELLDRIDIVEVIDRRVPLRKSGRNYTACCPFHDEKTPSFSVNQEKQFYYCFGCGAGGNAIGFLMDYERMDFPIAVESLADSAGLQVPREATAFQEAPRQNKNIYNLLEKAADYYCEQLRKHPQAQRAVDYLKQRGLSGAIAKAFDIGYAPPGWDNLLKQLGQTDEDRELLIAGGMLVSNEEENKLYDRFRDRIIFPIRDNRGRIIAFGGRVLGDDKPKYLNSPETEVFHKGKELYGLYQARKSNRSLQRLLIVEGYMDVVALAQHQINWAAATLGTATSTEHLKRVFRHCPEVVFCFDGDDAGRKAAIRALESALPVMEDGRQAKFLFLPQGEDPDSLVRKIGQHEFTRLVNQATPLESYLFESLAEGLDINSLDGKARLSTLAAPLIGKLPDGVFKELMMDSLAARTGLSTEKLNRILNQHQQHQQQAPRTTADNFPKPRQRQPQDKWEPPEITRNPALYAIGLLLHQPRAASQLDRPPALEAISDSHSELLRAMLELLGKRPDSTSAMLIGHWHGESWGEILRNLLQMDQLIPIEGMEEEFIDTIALLENKIRHRDIDQQVDRLSASNYSRMSPEDKERLKQLLIEKHSK